MTLTRGQALVAMAAIAGLLSGCIATVATIVIDAERERLADLERFELDVASKKCAGLSGMYGALVLDRKNLTDFDQRSDIVLDAMVRDGCPLPEGAE